MGEHKGYFRYTIGQRKGLGVAHSTSLCGGSASGEKRSGGREREALEARGWWLLISSGWLMSFPRLCLLRCAISKEKACSVEIVGPMRLGLYSKKVEMISPGQSVVLYSDDTVLGGGLLKKLFKIFD